MLRSTMSPRRFPRWPVAASIASWRTRPARCTAGSTKRRWCCTRADQCRAPGQRRTGGQQPVAMGAGRPVDMPLPFDAVFGNDPLVAGLARHAGREARSCPAGLADLPASSSPLVVLDTLLPRSSMKTRKAGCRPWRHSTRTGSPPCAVDFRPRHQKTRHRRPDRSACCAGRWVPALAGNSGAASAT